jgi:hypothetical protein
MNPYVLNGTRLRTLTLDDEQRLQAIAARLKRMAVRDEEPSAARLFQDVKVLLGVIGGEYAAETREL